MGVFKSYIVTIVILFSLNIFLAILIGSVQRFRSLEKDSYTRRAAYCLPCSDVLSHPDDGVPPGITTNENGTKCCADGAANLSALIEAYTNNWQDKRLHEENPKYSQCNQEDKSDTKPLIKLVLKDTQGDYDEVDWEEEISRYPTDLFYADRHVQVLKTGLYFVYSQVSVQFNPVTSKYPELPTQHSIGVRMVGSSPDAFTSIAKGSNSLCKFEGQEHGHTHNSTNFIGTLYRLHKGDNVFVRVYDKKQMIQNKHMNFFGMHMVSVQFNPLTSKYPELPTQHSIGVRMVGSSPDAFTSIAKGSNSLCKFEGQEHGHTHNSTNFIGTLYRLHKGDKVFVRVYDKKQIIPNKHMNFFGMHMV